MPKVGKNHSGAKKRFKVTAKGKVKFQKGWRNHLLINKSKRIGKEKELVGKQKKTVKTLLAA